MKLITCPFTCIILLLISACNKSNLFSEGTPIPLYYISLIFVDSLGNNVLNHRNVNYLPFNPGTFAYSSDLTPPALGEYRFSDYYGGYVFTMYAKINDIMSLPSYQETKLFHFYPCFDMKCDTMEILKASFRYTAEPDSTPPTGFPIYTGSEMYTDLIVWRGDTTYGLYGTALQVPYHHE